MKEPKHGFSSGFFLFILFLACYYFTTTGITAISISSTSPKANRHQQQPSPVKCKTEQGKEVDWFIAYKLPKNRTSSNPLVRTGLAYAYILPPTSASSPSRTTRNNSNRGTTTAGGAQVGSIFDAKNATSLYLEKGSLSKGHDDHEPRIKIGGETVSVKKDAFAWILSEKGIDSAESMVGQTLGKVYSNKKGNEDPVAFLTYNDQPPVGPTVMSGGHSKGIVVTSLASGFWIQHSVPHFPLIDTNTPHYQYPDTGKNNGQIFHCISFPSIKDIDNLGRIYEITKPHIANYSFPTDSLKNALPQLMAIVNHRHHPNHELEDNNLSMNFNRSQNRLVDNNNNGGGGEEQLSSRCTNEVDEKACELEQLNANQSNYNYDSHRPVRKQNWDELEFNSEGGKSFHAYIKGPSYYEEIYSSWIAPKYKTKLKVQTWLNGPNPYPSNCSSNDFSVFNIQEKSVAGHTWSTHHDHSKWGISTEQPLVCISDLNRMEHQLKRGGVTVCFMDSTTWSTFNSSIIDVQPCPRLSSVTGADAEHQVDDNSSARDNDPYINLTTIVFNKHLINREGEIEGVSNNIQMTRVTHVDDEEDKDEGNKNKWVSNVGEPLESKLDKNLLSTNHRQRRRKVKSRAYSFTPF